MKFISKEEFLKQPQKVQDAFIQWWKPSIGDLYHVTIIMEEDYEEGTIDHPIYRTEEYNYTEMYNEDDIELCDGEHIVNCIDGVVFPLLTEGQLRQFIEDKTGCKAIPDVYGKGEYNIGLIKLGKYCCIDYDNFENLGTDLLQAYWKVAIEIAKKEAK